MRVSEIARLYMYGRWATTRLLGAAEALTADAFRQPLGGSFGSLQATVDHLHGVEQLWLDRWLGRAPAKPSSLGDSLPSGFLSSWESIWEGQLKFITLLTDDALDAPFEYRNQSGAASRVGTGDMLLHVANHGTYHRGQIAIQIRQLGGTPAPSDFLLFTIQSRSS